MPRLRAWPSPPPQRRPESVAPVVAAESIFDDDLLYRSRVQTLFQTPEPSFSSSASLLQKEPQPGAARVGDCGGVSFRRLCIQRTAARTGYDEFRRQDMRARAGADGRRGCTARLGTGPGACGSDGRERRPAVRASRPGGLAHHRLLRSEIRFKTEAAATPAEPPQPVHAETQPPSPQPTAPQTRSGFRKA